MNLAIIAHPAPPSVAPLNAYRGYKVGVVFPLKGSGAHVEHEVRGVLILDDVEANGVEVGEHLEGEGVCRDMRCEQVWGCMC